MWGGYGNRRQELTDLLWRDADAIADDLTSVEAASHGNGIPLARNRDLDRMLLAPCPSPFTVSTEITFVLPSAAPVSLAVYDAHGRRVAAILERELPPGRHKARWHGTDSRGNPVPGGVYFFRLSRFGRSEVSKVVVRRRSELPRRDRDTGWRRQKPDRQGPRVESVPI
jgi:hypothetical protein